MNYDKLVRDNIPEYIRKRGGDPVFHIADDTEYWDKLKSKLLEEFAEFEKDENKEEFADLLEVVFAIGEYKKFDRNEIDAIRDNKAHERGRFEKRVILDES